MRILGIETSCDETAVAIVEDGNRVLASLLNSQVKIHAATGGIVPEVAAREHIPVILPLLQAVMKEANCVWADIDAIAVTQGPGLVGSLLTGMDTAKALALSYGLPLHAVNHIVGHIYANWLDTTLDDQPKFPIVVLTASGGHNELALIENNHRLTFLGSTIDDAAGEAFDKAARLLGLGYPGGPAIQKTAQNGNPAAFSLPRPMINDAGFGFSFSGLKTALLVTVKKLTAGGKGLTATLTADLAASFQEAIAETLVTKLLQAARKYDAAEVHIAGGVSANLRVRTLAGQWAEQAGIRLRYPQKPHYCTDNAAMIAAAAYFHPRLTAPDKLVVEPNLALAI